MSTTSRFPAVALRISRGAWPAVAVASRRRVSRLPSHRTAPCTPAMPPATAARSAANQGITAPIAASAAP